ncbi:MAG: DNA alkylation repair protein [Cytophagaceae bacterium]|jgi:3-methyladenine DNA glycosylase AlkC|nr:DNA alkylation repair protein [Cytophagaceae bacterium]
MAELLKNIYSESFLKEFSKHLKNVYSPLNEKKFLQDILSNSWDSLELKQRMRRLAEVMHHHLPKGFEHSQPIICQLTEKVFQGTSQSYSLHYMFIPEFIHLYGLEDLTRSIAAMECVTRFSSCEFAIRPFLISYPDKMLDLCLRWATHKHEMVRRLASEGCRPRLPWGMSVPWIKKHPEKILPILEILKNDSSETVRRSVANNLNDIAKDHPSIVIDILKRWKGMGENTDKLLRHASRTLLKQSNKTALAAFGIKKIKGLQLTQFRVLTKKINLGQTLHFEFEVQVPSASLIRIEYGIDYVKANGKTSRKIFQLSETELKKGTHSFSKKQILKDFTTRKHYAGKHGICLMINGEEMAQASFVLSV